HQGNEANAVAAGSAHGLGGAGSVLDEVGEQCAVVEVVVAVGDVAVIVHGVAAQVAGLVPAANGLAVVHILFAGVLVEYGLAGHVLEVAELRHSSSGRQLGVTGQRLIGSSHGPCVGQAGNAHHVLAFGLGLL